MEQFIYFLSLIILNFACGQSKNTHSGNYEVIDVKAFNQKIAPVDGTAKDIMRMYYPAKVDGEEGNQIITVKERNLENGEVEVQLIHDNMLDDSVRGQKYLMVLKKEGNRWQVLSLKKNWRCWKGRGHEDWEIEPCR